MDKKFEQMDENDGEFDFDDDGEEEVVSEMGLIFLLREKKNSFVCLI